MTARIESIEAGGLAFRVRRVDGAADGEPVILLHGFPETSIMWLPLLDRLEREGYRALAPDQRGYSPGARPDGVEAYHYRHLVADVIALADAAGFARFHLVGHDHGAGVGWMAAALHPDRIASWCALSVPHVRPFGQAIRHDPDQRERSRYIGRFQQDGIEGAEFLAGLEQTWAAHPAAEIAEYREVFSQPGALTGALNWYRSSVRYDGPDATSEVGEIDVPTLLLWGNQDRAIGRAGVDGTPALVRAPYRFVELDAGHWLIQEETERVIAEVLAHLRRYPAG